jgi:hypothetical protein
MAKKSIILYLIGVETGPNFVMRKAFENHFEVYCDFDWLRISSQIGLQAMQARFLDLLKERQPEYCFMQIQNPAAMDIPTIRKMANYTKIIHWTGDVRDSNIWYDWLSDIGKEVYLTLFTNETDVKKMRMRDVRSDYLQIGFDDIYFGRKPKTSGWPEIAFAANYYEHFELSEYRAETVRILMEEFGSRFRVFGAGWQQRGIQTLQLDQNHEAACYNSCKLSISVSNYCYDRYYSDRLLRIMACGCCAVSHCFPGLEKDFKPGENIVTFRDHRDLIEECYYYLEHEEERNRIAENAFSLVHSCCTWDARNKELILLLQLYG